MKPLIALLCLFALCLPCLAEGDACFSRPDAPYWHRDMDCRFAETGWLAEELPELTEQELPLHCEGGEHDLTLRLTGRITLDWFRLRP